MMLERDNMLLCVIDLQDGLLPRIANVETVLDQSIKLIRFARLLDIPTVWTEQYPKGLRRTTERVAAELTDLEPIEKVAFGSSGAPEFIVDALETAERDQILVVGIEAHVCVMQTVLDGIETDYDMYIPRDAVGSRNPADYEAGLERMHRGCDDCDDRDRHVRDPARRGHAGVQEGIAAYQIEVIDFSLPV